MAGYAMLLRDFSFNFARLSLFPALQKPSVLMECMESPSELNSFNFARLVFHLRKLWDLVDRRIQKDKYVVLAADVWDYFDDVDEGLWSNKEVALAWVSKGGDYMHDDFPVEFEDDEDIFLELAEHNPSDFLLLVCF